MQITTLKNLDSALREAEKTHQLLHNLGNTALAEEMGELIRGVKEQRFVIGVVGSVNRGKSTLVNGLLRRRDDHCAPIAKFPATNVVSIFGHSATPSTQVVFANNKTQGITEHEIRLYVTEEHNPDNRKGVRSVEVRGPFDGLENGVYLVDTPGAHNALSATHGEILLEFLPVADAVIFLVAANEPLTDAEQKLLKAIDANHTRKLFFAVNMVDRVDSGDLTPVELAEGIDHNRKVLANTGFPGAAIYEISAKNYFEKQYDPGTERLLADIRALIARGRLEVMVARLRDRTQAALTRCEAELSVALRESTATVGQLETERKSLAATRDELLRGKSDRESRFIQAWEAAFAELRDDLHRIRKDLANEYSALIDRASAMRIPALAQTIHADVQVSFSERLRPRVEHCEKALGQALSSLKTSVDTDMLILSTKIASGPTATTTITDGLKLGFAAVPALVTGTVSAALPGIISSMIAAAAPAVAAVTWNPATWIPYLSTAAATTAVTGTGAVVTTALSAVAMPFAIGAFGLAGFRAYSAWKENKNLQRNDLKLRVIAMVDEGCEQVMDQINSYRASQTTIILEFNKAIAASIDQADKRLEELLVNGPSPAQIQRLEQGMTALKQHLQLLPAPNTTAAETGAGSSVAPPLVDTLRSPA